MITQHSDNYDIPYFFSLSFAYMSFSLPLSHLKKKKKKKKYETRSLKVILAKARQNMITHYSANYDIPYFFSLSLSSMSFFFWFPLSFSHLILYSHDFVKIKIKRYFL